MGLANSVDKSNTQKGKWGGKRPNGGRRHGSKNKKTLEDQILFDELRQRVIRGKDVLINAQFNLAKGASYLYKITTLKNGVKLKPELIEDLFTIEQYLNGDLDGSVDVGRGQSEYYYITTEKPDNKAIDSLIDRIIGKSVQRTEITGKDGEKFLPVPLIPLPNAILDNNGDTKDTQTK